MLVLCAWLAVPPALLLAFQVLRRLHDTNLVALATAAVTEAVPVDFRLVFVNGSAVELPPRGYRLELPEPLVALAEDEARPPNARWQVPRCPIFHPVP